VVFNPAVAPRSLRTHGTMTTLTESGHGRRAARDDDRRPAPPRPSRWCDAAGDGDAQARSLVALARAPRRRATVAIGDREAEPDAECASRSSVGSATAAAVSGWPRTRRRQRVPVVERGDGPPTRDQLAPVVRGPAGRGAHDAARTSVSAPATARSRCFERSRPTRRRARSATMPPTEKWCSRRRRRAR
jgi:hypothetical protein